MGFAGFTINLFLFSKIYRSQKVPIEKSRIRETKNLLTYADSSTAVKKLLSIFTNSALWAELV